MGGTFDPIHLGHLEAARVAIDCARLDRVLFVPSAQPPHRGPAVAAAADRLAMCRLAVAGDPRFEVCDVEVRRGGTSYTADTMAELRRLLPDDELFLILGWDAARMFGTWQRPEQVLALATIVVVGRPGTETPDEGDLAAAGIDPARAVLCLGATPAVSGSELRHGIAEGAPLEGGLSGAVEGYIAAHRLYGDNRRVES
jgi:nicotinate-nucleotide adenylyltransferase